MSLGERIGTHRKRMGISQEELGHRMGVSRQAVSKWETGRAVPDMENLLALARLFGVPVSELRRQKVRKQKHFQRQRKYRKRKKPAVCRDSG